MRILPDGDKFLIERGKHYPRQYFCFFVDHDLSAWSQKSCLARRYDTEEAAKKDYCELIKRIRWYGKETLEVLRRDFLPGAKYMNEPRISRYVEAISDKPKQYETVEEMIDEFEVPTVNDEESQPSRIGDFIVRRQSTQAIASGHAHEAATMLGKLGGASKSRAKQRASKKNGSKGGRPKKTVDRKADEQ